MWHRRSQYARGADFERKVKAWLLEVHGAYRVIRSAGSKGEADLVAFFEATRPDWGRGDGTANVWLVQCKRDGKLPEHEREALLDFSEYTECPAYLARRSNLGPGVILEPLKRS